MYKITTTIPIHSLALTSYIYSECTNERSIQREPWNSNEEKKIEIKLKKKIETFGNFRYIDENRIKPSNIYLNNYNDFRGIIQSTTNNTNFRLSDF